MSRPVRIVGAVPQTVTDVEPIENDYYVKSILTHGVERLPQLNNKHFSYPNLVRITTLDDESSLLHAVANALYVNYRQGMYNDGSKVSQVDWVKTLRKDLAIALTEKHPAGNGKATYYDSINLAADYKVDDIVKYFNSDKILNLDFLEYICDFLKVDIYVIDLTSMNIIDTDIKNYNSYDGSRTSIVIGLIDIPQANIYHFETIAIEIAMKKYSMPFKADNPLIIKIKQYLNLT